MQETSEEEIIAYLPLLPPAYLLATGCAYLLERRASDLLGHCSSGDKFDVLFEIRRW